MAGTLSVQKIQGLASSATPTTVEISSGHKISGNITHGSGSVFPAGHIIQTVTATLTGQVSASTTSDTGLTVNLTPTSTDSTILITGSSTIYVNGSAQLWNAIYINGSEDTVRQHQMYFNEGGDKRRQNTFCVTYGPSNTNSHAFNWKIARGSGSFVWGATGNQSMLMAQEIAG